ncbi:UNVERIFIED_CONTAM: SRS domain protein [Hammondia hammondi]|eukprot:XP_008889463.1 SRS domain protein [Hammondia hammondi]
MSSSFNIKTPSHRQTGTQQSCGVVFSSPAAAFFLFIAGSAQRFAEASGERLGTLKYLGDNRYSCVQEDGTGANPGVGFVKLDAQNPQLFFFCVGQDNNFMPVDGAAAPLEVCPLTAATKSECDSGKTPLKTFLPYAADSWLDETLVPDTLDHKLVLTVPADGFPPVRQQFKLGCGAKLGHYCMLTLTVEPFRAVVRGQKALCAYSASESGNLQLSMSVEKNSIASFAGNTTFPNSRRTSCRTVRDRLWIHTGAQPSP